MVTCIFRTHGSIELLGLLITGPQLSLEVRAEAIEMAGQNRRYSQVRMALPWITPVTYLLSMPAIVASGNSQPMGCFQRSACLTSITKRANMWIRLSRKKERSLRILKP